MNEIRHIDRGTDRASAGSTERIVDTGPMPGTWDWVVHLERLAQTGLLAAAVIRRAVDGLTAVSATCQLGLARQDPTMAAQALIRARELADRVASELSVFHTFARWSPRDVVAVDVTALLDDAIRMVGPASRAARVDLRVDAPDRLAVRGDRPLLLQILVGVLLDTVSQARRPADRIDVVVASWGESVECAVWGPSSCAGGAEAVDGRGGVDLARRIAIEVGGSLESSVETDRTVHRLRLPRVRTHLDGLEPANKEAS